MKDYEYNYEYDQENDKKYCYDGTNVLINKLNTKDWDTLRSFEREYSFVRYSELKRAGI